MAWAVSDERSQTVLQAVLDRAPPALIYFSDQLGIYETLVYPPSIHLSVPTKTQTYSVEGDNAELRHYLARLARRSRCFSRCLTALRRAVKLFVYAWNRRQLYRLQFPTYPAHVFQFAYP